MIRALVLLLLASPALAEAPVVPRFVAENGALPHSFIGEWEFMVGGGVATFDCSGDGLPEVFLSGGTAPAALFLNESRADDLAFRQIDSGLEAEMVSGAYPLDVDADGIIDLALLRVGESRLMRGLGDCRFEDAGAAWGFESFDAWTTAFAATWEAGADWPTLAFGTYIDRQEEAFPWGSCTPGRFYRGNAGRFDAPLELTPAHCPLSILFTDWNRSGQPALRMSNDREYYKGGQEQLWHVEPGQSPRLYTEAEGWQRLRIWGMGIASRDLDGDGFPEYALTSMADNKLQRLKAPGPQAQPQYADVAFALGVTAHRPYTGGDLRPSTAWHVAFEDVNNDARPDLFLAKGNVWSMPDFAEKDPNNLLLQRADGTFEEAGDRAGVASVLQGRGAALTDLNADGRVDLVVLNRNGPAELWRNDGPAGNWVAIDPVQAGPNRNAVNGWVEVRVGDHIQRREVLVGGGHAGGSLGPLHFGLGSAESAEARVIWPDGTEGAWQVLSPNLVHQIAR